jgi:fatty-acyl-CoA synthase
VPDERMGEEICVWIKRKPNASINEEEVKQFCRGQISQFKIPKYIKFVESFPINANAKILKNEMRQQAVKELNLK